MMLTSLLLSLAGVLGPVTPGAPGARPGLPGPSTVRVTLIDASLRARVVELTGLHLPGKAGGSGGGGAGGLSILDAGETRPMALGTDGPLAIAPEGWIIDGENPPSTQRRARSDSPIETDPAAWATLVDGQRLIGRIAPAPGSPDDGQVVHWSHPRLGPMNLPLERVERIVLAAAATGSELAQDRAGDSVVLRNGDRVTGFIDAVGDEIAVSQRAVGGKTAALGEGGSVKIALEQAAVVQLSNAPEHASGPMVWLADGSVVAADTLDVDIAAAKAVLGARLSVSIGGAARTTIELPQLRGVVFDAGRLSALASLPVAGFGPTGGRRLAEAPRRIPVTDGSEAAGTPSPLGADDIALSGPMFAEWPLPVVGGGGSVRIAGWISLDDDARGWGDCEVVVAAADASSGGSVRELLRQRVNASHPVAPVNIAIPFAPGGQRLRISVEAGEGGPIKDNVTLRRMMVLGDRAGARPER